MIATLATLVGIVSFSPSSEPERAQGKLEGGAQAGLQIVCSELGDDRIGLRLEEGRPGDLALLLVSASPEIPLPGEAPGIARSPHVQLFPLGRLDATGASESLTLGPNGLQWFPYVRGMAIPGSTSLPIVATPVQSARRPSPSSVVSVQRYSAENIAIDDPECSNVPPLWVSETVGMYIPDHVLPNHWYELAPGARYQQFSDGTATFVGEAVQWSNPAFGFIVTLQFAGGTQPWDLGSCRGETPYYRYGPLADPVCEDSLATLGGPIDPYEWRCFPTIHGTLVGTGLYAGAVADLTVYLPSNPTLGGNAPFQIGIGANDKNLRLGGAGWFSTFYTSQPSSGVHTLPNHPDQFTELFVDLELR